MSATIWIPLLGLLGTFTIIGMMVFFRWKDAPRLKAWIDTTQGSSDGMTKYRVVIQPESYHPIPIRRLRLVYGDGAAPTEHPAAAGHTAIPPGEIALSLDDNAERVRAVSEIVIEDGSGKLHRSKVKPPAHE